MTSTWSRSCMISSRTVAGVAGLMATPTRFPNALMLCTVRDRLLLPSQWTKNESVPACTNSSTKKSGFEIIRCASRGRCVTLLSELMIGGPIERLGTKCPSITSTLRHAQPLLPRDRPDGRNRRRGSTERASLHYPSRLALELAVTADQVVGRTVMAELWLGHALELGDDALGQNLAEFDAPPLERMDVPDGALGEHAVLVERNQLSQRRRGQSVHQNGV